MFGSILPSPVNKKPKRWIHTIAQRLQFTPTSNEQQYNTLTHHFHDATIVDDLGAFYPEIFNPVTADRVSPASCFTCHPTQTTAAQKCLQCKMFLNDSQNRLVLVLQHLAYYKEKLDTLGPVAQIELERRIDWLNAREKGIRLGANQIINRHNDIRGQWAREQVVESPWGAEPQITPEPQPYASPYATLPPVKPSYPEPTLQSSQAWRPYGP
ncbi:hypothetical protein GLAREA_03816 [Glarea lozoyensis ATCC 20868]|uniref:Uncharacterized protein n=1 Tax=Glarea lozoyensis (strain ATCC 20868 / MF5171) TaxID=1116229 RepID=S3D125_GLAL2|nr:uncharacterized protein GLAREA_03816 [Glarea lozoyensis ATCC 20868]EPE30849.1 hypothetical protein GLAREA_03816 [Glarea lozoyensis ATCC 20868]